MSRIRGIVHRFESDLVSFSNIRIRLFVCLVCGLFFCLCLKSATSKVGSLNMWFLFVCVDSIHSTSE